MVKLDVILRSPVVIVPQNAASRNYFQINLGQVAVTNTIQSVRIPCIYHIPNAALQDASPPMENIEAAISETYISTFFENSKRVDLLRNVNANVQVKLQLLVQPDHHHPTMKLLGVVSEIDFVLTEVQYELLLAIIAENIAAVGKEAGPSTPQPVVATETTTVPLTLVASDAIGEAAHGEANARTRIELALDVESISIAVMRGDGWREGSRDPLASLVASDITSVATISSDDSLKVRYCTSSIIDLTLPRPHSHLAV